MLGVMRDGERRANRYEARRARRRSLGDGDIVVATQGGVVSPTGEGAGGT